MSNIKRFEFQGHPVRVVIVDDHEEWVAKDVCDVLDLENVTRALEGLDEDELSIAQLVDSAGRMQEMRTVLESGLYSLILRSRKPAARAFRRWVTHEVLPQIRRTGYYVREGDEARVIEQLVAQLEANERLIGRQTEVIGMLTTNLEGLSAKVVQLEQRLAVQERAHPFGLLGDDARTLRAQMTAVARIRGRLGDQRRTVTIFNEVDGEVRDAIGYPKRAGASWECCPSELRGKAFSLVARMHIKAERSLSRSGAKASGGQGTIIDLIQRRNTH